MTGFMCPTVFSCKLGTESSGSMKGVQFLDQLTYYEGDQEGFRPASCFAIFSTSRPSVRTMCGQSDRFSVSYTFDGIQANETKINVGQYICYDANSDLDWHCSYGRPYPRTDSRYFIGSTKLIMLISWRKHKYVP